MISYDVLRNSHLYDNAEEKPDISDVFSVSKYNIAEAISPCAEMLLIVKTSGFSEGFFLMYATFTQRH